MSKKSEKQEAIKLAIEELLKQVEEMPVGGNLMNLLEREIPKMNRFVVEQAIDRRDEINQVREDAFPPSGSLSEMREADSDNEVGKA